MTFLPFILQALALYRLCLARGPGRVADSVTAFLMLIDVATAFISEGPRWPSAASWGMSLALAVLLLARRRLRSSGSVRALHVAVFACGTLVSFAAASLAGWLVPIELPALTGQHAVGKMQWVVRSPTRRDIHNPDPAAPREFLVSVYYPAVPRADLEEAPYTSAAMAEEVAGSAGSRIAAFFLKGELRRLRSRSHLGAALSAERARHPVVIFSPGLGWIADMHSFYLEQLASHGYVVFGVTHPGHAPLVEFPDGRRARSVGWSALDAVPQDEAQRLRNDERASALLDDLNSRAQPWTAAAARIREFKVLSSLGRAFPIPVRKDDLIELLDRLQVVDADPSFSPLAGHLDLDRVAVVGMSYGGPTAHDVCIEDARCKAVVNMDGEEFGRLPLETGHRPALWLYTSGGWEGPRASPLRRLSYERYAGPAYRVGFDDANHGTFADWPFYTAEVRWLTNPLVRLLDGEHIDRDVPPVVLEYLLDFLGHTLDGRELRLLAEGTRREGVHVGQRNTHSVRE